MFIRQMTYLATLAREKHFGRAAELCNVTQSTLSAGLKALERELDMRLVIRSPRFMGLTPEGERVVDWAHQILSDYENLKQDATEYRKGLRGTLRLGVIPAAMPSVAQITAPFLARHSQVKVDVRSMTSIEIQNGLDKFELDAGLTYLENEPLVRVRKTPLYSERYMFLTGKSGPLASRESISWCEAAEANLCLLDESMQNRRILNNIANAAGVELAPSVTSNSFLGVCSHVCSGEWSSIIPQSFSYIFHGCDDLVMLDLTDPVHSQVVGLVTSARDPLPPLARALLDCASRVQLDAAVKEKSFALT
jgi:DNA-binding transcriptional LysR family regulator